MQVKRSRKSIRLSLPLTIWQHMLFSGPMLSSGGVLTKLAEMRGTNDMRLEVEERLVYSGWRAAFYGILRTSPKKAMLYKA